MTVEYLDLADFIVNLKNEYDTVGAAERDKARKRLARSAADRLLPICG